MSITFDPKNSQTRQTVPLQTSTTANSEIPEVKIDEKMVTTEMELLFEGVRHLEEAQSGSSVQTIDVPGLDTDILRDLPILGENPKDVEAIIQKYRQLKNNLIERRRNFTVALDGFLQPHEAMDIYQRMDAIDAALIKIEQYSEQAFAMKKELEGKQREFAKEERMREERERADREALALERERARMPEASVDFSENDSYQEGERSLGVARRA